MASRASRRWLFDFAIDLAPVIVLTGLYMIAARAARSWLEWPVETSLGFALVHGGVNGMLTLAILLLGTGAWVAIAGRRHHGERVARGRIARIADIATPYRMGGGFAVLVLYALFLDAFVGFKQAIPHVNPFSWDVAFMRLDRVVHFGHDPWKLIHPVFGYPIVTKVIDFHYYLWFPINTACLAGFLWTADRVLRTRFYLAFWLSWIMLGTVLAYALSSAGPIYYQFVTGSAGPFADLIAYLDRVDGQYGLIAAEVHRGLWADYAIGSDNYVMKGISAMPSMHVALPVLYTIAGWRVDRRLGLVFLAVTVLTVIGSVHLAWHYAIDGYLSAAIVPVLWWGSGKVARWWHRPERGGSGDPLD